MPDPSDDTILGQLAAASQSDLTADWLDELPVSVSALDELMDYPPTTYPGEESVVISTRIPISWMGQFEEFRDKIGSRMPKKIWSRNSDLLRWFVGYGFKELRKIQDQLDAGLVQPTPLLAAQLFLEQTGGTLVARANVRSDAREKSIKIAESLRDLMGAHEYAEAADMITRWFDGARAIRPTSTYWEATMIGSLLRIPDMPRIVAQLCRDGFIVDPEILDQYDGLVEAADRQAQEEIDSLPLTVADDEENEHATNSTRRSK